MRAYYLCPACHAGHVPVDAELGFSASTLTPGAEEIATLAGTCDSFADAAEKLLPKMAGLRLSESTVERTTEAAGARLGALWDGGHTLGTAADWRWNHDAWGRTVAYVSVDATGVGMQGARGAQADGRMVWVGKVFNPDRYQGSSSTSCRRWRVKRCWLEISRAKVGQYGISSPPISPRYSKKSPALGRSPSRRPPSPATPARGQAVNRLGGDTELGTHQAGQLPGQVSARHQRISPVLAHLADEPEDGPHFAQPQPLRLPHDHPSQEHDGVKMYTKLFGLLGSMPFCFKIIFVTDLPPRHAFNHVCPAIPRRRRAVRDPVAPDAERKAASVAGWNALQVGGSATHSSTSI